VVHGGGNHISLHAVERVKTDANLPASGGAQMLAVLLLLCGRRRAVERARQGFDGLGA
jgi:hypothetical protein